MYVCIIIFIQKQLKKESFESNTKRIILSHKGGTFSVAVPPPTCDLCKFVRRATCRWRELNKRDKRITSKGAVKNKSKKPLLPSRSRAQPQKQIKIAIFIRNTYERFGDGDRRPTTHDRRSTTPTNPPNLLGILKQHTTFHTINSGMNNSGGNRLESPRIPINCSKSSFFFFSEEYFLYFFPNRSIQGL